MQNHTKPAVTSLLQDLNETESEKSSESENEEDENEGFQNDDLIQDYEKVQALNFNRDPSCNNQNERQTRSVSNINSA